jgi:hypothetical protein
MSNGIGSLTRSEKWSKNIEEGYLLTQVVLPNEVFQPKAFFGLTTDWRWLFFVEEQETSPTEVK